MAREHINNGDDINYTIIRGTPRQRRLYIMLQRQLTNNLIGTIILWQ